MGIRASAARWLLSRRGKAGHPLCLIGDSGTGKSHLLIGRGIAAAEAGYRVRYTLASKLVNMPSSAELRRMLRIERWMGIIVPRLARRLVNGKSPQPGWLPRRWLTVVSGDVDLDGRIGAVLVVWRPGSATAETHTELFERCGGQWQYMGGGSTSGGDVAAERSAAGQPRQVGVIELGGSSGGASAAWRLQHRDRSVVEAPWVGASEVQAAAEVDHLLIGERRRQVQMPEHGRLIVVWKSRSTGAGGVRPLIVAIGHDGSELSRIGPHDSMDSYTWAKVSSQQELLHAD
jgi:IstB-like ATP binding protein